MQPYACPRIVSAGVDDAIAILMALAAETRGQCVVQAITTVMGNTTVANVNRNVATLLHYAGKDHIPVYHGASKPLVSKDFLPADFHGENGFGNAELDWADVRALSTHAAIAIIDLARANPNELTCVCLGPLTNVALACSIEPTLPSLLKQLVWMGGSSDGSGNVTPSAEFNVYTDPEAAHIVLNTFPSSVMVSWNLTLCALFPWDVLQGMRIHDSRVGALVKAITENPYFASGVQFSESAFAGGAVVCDAIAVAVALCPSLVSASKHMRVCVELSPGICRGATVCDSRVFSTPAEPPNVSVILDIDRHALRYFFSDLAGVLSR